MNIFIVRMSFFVDRMYFARSCDENTYSLILVNQLFHHYILNFLLIWTRKSQESCFFQFLMFKFSVLNTVIFYYFGSASVVYFYHQIFQLELSLDQFSHSLFPLRLKFDNIFLQGKERKYF